MKIVGIDGKKVENVGHELFPTFFVLYCDTRRAMYDYNPVPFNKVARCLRITRTNIVCCMIRVKLCKKSEKQKQHPHAVTLICRYI